LPLQEPCFPPINARGPTDSNQRWKPVAHLPVRGLEADQGIVAAINGCDYNASGSKIYADFHESIDLLADVMLNTSDHVPPRPVQLP
jgi:hypothetical protein